MSERQTEPRTVECTVQFDNSEPQVITVVTEHFVDSWFTTKFQFRMDGATATLQKIETGGTYYVKQNEPAREQAHKTVKDLPFVQAVEMF
jgi:hypothetical protein